jgi:hypothetical protein
MTVEHRTFAVASDDALIDLIAAARNRLVVIAPALSVRVAKALARRLEDLGSGMKIILDSDPEVYRLGFGDQAALDTIRAASTQNLFDLREQPGVRIGVVISDDTTMVYSPVSKNIEAGSTSVQKPNAVVLRGAAADRMVTAAGADPAPDAPPAEIGNEALEPKRVEQMQADLKARPPKPFDITRRMNIFSSRVQYVEFSASNYRLTTRQIPLPPELVDVADDDLRNRISGRIKAPLDGIGKLDVKIELNGKSETIKVDDEWLKKERKRIEDAYTFQINNFGRLILYNDRDAFKMATSRFKSVAAKYQEVLHESLLTKREEFERRIVEEFLPRWKQNQPPYFARWNIQATPATLEAELRKLAGEVFNSAITFDPPVVRIVYKNVAPENVDDPRFLEELKRIMVLRRVPQAIIDSLFESGQAAPESGAFLGRWRL